MAVSVDALDDSKALADKLSLSFPLISDTELALTKGFGLYDDRKDIAWPAVFVVGSDGAVAWRSFEDTYKERVPIDDIIAAAQAAK